LRKSGILSEVIFWKTFKNKEVLGWDIDRQIIIGRYIVDFFIPELGLVIEIDGKSHDLKYDYDVERENYLKSLSMEIIRINDREIKNNLDNCVEFLKQKVKEREQYLRQRR
jgi:very-short-patch-repair endonuclease